MNFRSSLSSSKQGVSKSHIRHQFLCSIPQRCFKRILGVGSTTQTNVGLDPFATDSAREKQCVLSLSYLHMHEQLRFRTARSKFTKEFADFHLARKG
jgi:hypothetical protein